MKISPGLANSEHAHASGLMLKFSILLDHDPGSDIIPSGNGSLGARCWQWLYYVLCVFLVVVPVAMVWSWDAVFEDILQHSDLSIDMALEVLKAATQKEK